MFHLSKLRTRGAHSLPIALAFLWLIAAPQVPAQDKGFPDLLYIYWDTETMEIFESRPPSALDWATFLHSLKQHEPGACVIAPLWHWPNIDPTELKLLTKQLTGPPFFLSALLDNDPVEIDPTISSEAFPQGINLNGDPTNVPRFTGVPILPDPSLLEHATAGFIHIDLGLEITVDDYGIHVPVIARGPDDEIIPSLALSLVVQMLGLDWDRVTVTPDESLDMSNDLSPVPIDDFARVRVAFPREIEIPRMPGHQILPSAPDGKVTPNPEIKDAVVFIGDNQAESRLFPMPDGTRISRAEVVARAAQFIFHRATSPLPPPRPRPTPTKQPTYYPTSETPELPYSGNGFFDLKRPNAGNWALGALWTFLIIYLQIATRRRRSASEDTASKPE